MKIISFVSLGNWGRLGNQLFELAGIIGLCDRYAAVPAFPSNWKYRDEFNIPDNYFQDVIPEAFVPPKQFCYDPDLLEKVKHYNIVNVTEYLQSEKYFIDVKDKVIKYLTPIGTKYLGDYSVGIHVRRGDFVGHTLYQQLGHEYYLSAIRQYFSDSQYKFYVCSDDPGYCKMHFREEEFIIEQRAEIEDLRILAGCRHHILSNSTFGWWGAYLANSSLVIRPPKIYSGEYSRTHYESGFWPDEWVIHEGFKIGFLNSIFHNSADKKHANGHIAVLKKIVNEVFINASFVDNPGLMNGKMGICIFFYHFARITENKIYEDFAGELLDDVCEEINSETPFDFENGLAGIGWGIEYLVQNGFVEGDTDEVLNQLDQKLYQKLTSSPAATIGLLSGITGIGLYFLSRIKNKGTNKNIIMLTNEDMVIQFIEELERRFEKTERHSAFYNGGSLVFDPSWDYLALLGLLSEIYGHNIYKNKVGKIICNLLEPLRKDDNLPQLIINRLLMVMVMRKLKKCKIDTPVNKNFKNETETFIQNDKDIDAILEIITGRLIAGIDPSCINSGLAKVNFEITEYQFGVSWIYRKLFEIPDSLDEREAVLWQTIDWNLKNKVLEPQWFDRQQKDKTSSMGLLTGFSGVGIQLISL